ncbi:MAG: hypothetical protein HOW73_36650 [Polyangiaceae bacterium]|nr:hypothetical protein [Polyangiaceae bacterium]
MASSFRMGSAFPIVIAACAMIACSAGSGGTGAGPDNNTGGSGGGGASQGGNGGAPGSGGVPSDGGTSSQFMTGPGGAPPTNNCDGEGPDYDQDGFTVEEGDCNDCDPNANPGAIEVIGEAPTGEGGGSGGEGGAGEYVPVDEDCDGTADNVAGPCDTNLPLAGTDPLDGARAVEICKQAATEKDWGIVSAQYVRGDGTPYAANQQVGILNTFGPNVMPRAGASMLALSSGYARLPGQAGACTNHSCTVLGLSAPGYAPPDFPQDVPDCPISDVVHDDIGLNLTLRAPTNATGFKFNFKFHSFEFGEYVCTTFNDQFIALVNPAPPGSVNGNISFDAEGNPVSVNIAFFDVCASCSDFAQNCYDDPTAVPPVICPNPPANCCSAGAGELAGTGFENGFGDGEDAGGTSWLQTQAPVTGGETFELRFAIWDVGDTAWDSTSIVDAFEWIANGGEVPVETTPAPPPM